VNDVDAMYEQALKAGGISMLAPTDQEYGDRNAWVKDPFDNVWYIAAPVRG
jgi:PhnB protein